MFHNGPQSAQRAWNRRWQPCGERVFAASDDSRACSAVVATPERTATQHVVVVIVAHVFSHDDERFCSSLEAFIVPRGQ